MTAMLSLMFAMLDGEDRSFMEELYDRHFRLMFATAWKYLSDKAAVDDVVGDSCLALMGKLDTLREMDQSDLRVYIVTTVRHMAINCIRKQSSSRTHMAGTLDEADEFDAAAHSLSLEDRIVLTDELRHVLEALERLPEKEKQVLQMKYDEQMSDAEIAQIVGLSPNSISQYVRRAREHIKTMVYAD